jgi:hypothetical protein
MYVLKYIKIPSSDFETYILIYAVYSMPFFGLSTKQNASQDENIFYKQIIHITVSETEKPEFLWY